MELSRVAGALGAEVTGFNVGAALASGEGHKIRALLNEHEVLFFVISNSNPVSSEMLRRCLARFKRILLTVP